jgi:hypothetical protein
MRRQNGHSWPSAKRRGVPSWLSYSPFRIFALAIFIFIGPAKAGRSQKWFSCTPAWSMPTLLEKWRLKGKFNDMGQDLFLFFPKCQNIGEISSREMPK